MQVHLALDIVDQMCKEGLTISINTIHSILNASEESFDFNLVCFVDSTYLGIIYILYWSFGYTSPCLIV
jgi:hypothetical protein